MLNSRHGFWKVGRRAGAWLSGGRAFCFLGSASRLLSHRWGTVKLDDCNLPGQNSERNHLRLAFEQGHSIGRAAESTQAAFPLAMRVGRCKPRPHKRPRSKSSGLFFPRKQGDFEEKQGGD